MLPSLSLESREVHLQQLLGRLLLGVFPNISPKANICDSIWASGGLLKVQAGYMCWILGHVPHCGSCLKEPFRVGSTRGKDLMTKPCRAEIMAGYGRLRDLTWKVGGA